MSPRSATAPPPWQVWGALSVVYVVWGSTYLAIAFVVEDLPPLLSASLRFAVAAVLTARVDPPAVVLVSSRSRTDYGSRIEDCRARGFIAKAELSGDAVRRLLPMLNRVPPARP